jgi:phosphoribosylformylglycinamidine cyclo-ligase
MDYRQAGVDIDRAATFVERIRAATESTRRPEWLDGLGGFGAFFRLDLSRYRRPILVSGTDGVGTKLRLAQALGRHDSIGIDLVAMCVNDILTHGAEPLFFLDYLAVGVLDVEASVQIIEGIADGCRQAGCSLVGGETAEMPGFYPRGDYDLAGFAVGAVEEEAMLTGKGIKPGDALIGLPSSGPHSNGYSLVRAILGTDLAGELNREAPWGGETLGDALLRPTSIYVKRIQPLLATGAIRGMAHITGGGLTENLPRILPRGTGAELRLGSWPEPPVFGFLRQRGPVAEEEMRRVFNLGLGFLLAVDGSRADEVLALLSPSGPAYPVGRIVPGEPSVRFV